MRIVSKWYAAMILPFTSLLIAAYLPGGSCTSLRGSLQSSLQDAQSFFQTAVVSSSEKDAFWRDRFNASRYHHPVHFTEVREVSPGKRRASPCAEPGSVDDHSMVYRRLGLLERTVLLAIGGCPGPDGGREHGPFSALQTASAMHDIVMSSPLLVTGIVVAGVITLCAVTFFCMQPHYSKTVMPPTYEVMNEAPEELNRSLGQSSSEKSHAGVNHQASLLPVSRYESLPGCYNVGNKQPLAVLDDGGHPSMSSEGGRQSGSSRPNSARHMSPAVLKSSPLPPPSPNDLVFRPASSSPPGQGVPGGHFASAPKQDGPLGSGGEVSPPPLCSSLVLPACEGHFAVAVPALAAVDEAGGGSLDIVGLTGNRLLRATAQDVSGGRLLEISMTHPGSAPRATVAPPVKSADGALMSPPGRMPPCGALEIRGADGSLYGVLESKSPSHHVVRRRGRDVLAIHGTSRSLELTVHSGERLVADATGNSVNFGGQPHMELRVEAGIDPILVISCVLAIVLQSS